MVIILFFSVPVADEIVALYILFREAESVPTEFIQYSRNIAAVSARDPYLAP